MTEAMRKNKEIGQKLERKRERPPSAEVFALSGIFNKEGRRVTSEKI